MASAPKKNAIAGHGLPEHITAALPNVATSSVVTGHTNMTGSINSDARQIVVMDDPRARTASMKPVSIHVSPRKSMKDTPIFSYASGV